MNKEKTHEGKALKDEYFDRVCKASLQDLLKALEFELESIKKMNKKLKMHTQIKSYLIFMSIKNIITSLFLIFFHLSFHIFSLLFSL